MAEHTSPLNETLAHLRALVSFDTQNPPRDIGDDLFDYLVEHLDGFEHEREDLGEGCRWLYSVRGEDPRVLINCHLDTVPANDGWTRDPHDLLVDNGVAIGLGACDIKGAAACQLTAAARTEGDIALLFTTDEEAGSSRCVKTFLERAQERGLTWDAVLVSEPTTCRAVLEHRGIVTYSGRFNGVPGHASQARALVDSANHELVLWASRAVAFAREQAQAASYATSLI